MQQVMLWSQGFITTGLEVKKWRDCMWNLEVQVRAMWGVDWRDEGWQLGGEDDCLRHTQKMEFKVDNYNRNRDREINLGERHKREFNCGGGQWGRKKGRKREENLLECCLVQEPRVGGCEPPEHAVMWVLRPCFTWPLGSAFYSLGSDAQVQ